ncbi:MAG: hypothetical protein JXD23_02035 [Spirochaetales bacterium]|nr:hypothetical protein [Spirochaetales bacterium]
MRFEKKFRLCLFAFLMTVVASPSLSADEKQKDVIDKEIKQALLLFDMDRGEAAIYRLQQLQERYPNDASILQRLCEMAIAGKNWAYAIVVLEKLAAVKPKDVGVRVILMDVYKAYQMPIQEIKTAKDIIDIDPGDVDTLERLAKLYHGENMFLEEERVRLMLDGLKPFDLDNLEKLAVFYAEEGNVREETVIRERIHSLAPHDIANSTRLIYLYNEAKDMYQKLLLLREVLAEVKDPSGELAAEYNATYSAYKKSLLIFDVIGSTTSAQYKDIGDDRIITMVENFGYSYTSLESVSTVKLNIIYTHLFDIPRDPEQDQPYHVGNITLQTSYNTATPDQKVNFSAVVGFENILIYDAGSSTPYPYFSEDKLTAVWNDTYKIFPTAGLDFDAEIARYFYLHASCHSVLFEEIESYRSPLRDNDAGAGLRLLLPDGTSIMGNYELHWVWNRLLRSRVTAELAFVIFSSDAVYDYRGGRVGYVKEIPGTQLEFSYEFEFMTATNDIPFYTEGEFTHTHLVDLIFKQRLSETVAFNIAAEAKYSSTNEYTVGGRFSLFDLHSESNVKFSLDLFYEYQNVLPIPDASADNPVHEAGLSFFISFNLT